MLSTCKIGIEGITLYARRFSELKPKVFQF